LLQIVPTPERASETEREQERAREKSRHSLGGSQRLRSNKHRPNILPVSNLSIFTRSTTTAPVNSGNHETITASAAVASPCSSSSSSPRDKDKKSKMPPSHGAPAER